MKNANYRRTITVNAPAEEVIKKISQVKLWWHTAFSGKAEKLNDKFHISMDKKDESFADFQVTELIPNKKVVWEVTDSFLVWFNDKKEWNGTKVVFEISEKENATQIDFTHIGLTPAVECYEACEAGWNEHVTDSLVKFINEGDGHPRQL